MMQPAQQAQPMAVQSGLPGYYMAANQQQYAMPAFSPTYQAPQFGTHLRKSV